MLFRKIILRIFFFFCLGYFCLLPISFADSIVLKSGQIVEGKIIENTAKLVKIDFDGVELTYFKEEIATINQDQADASKGLTSLYEAFKSSKKVPAQPIINQKAQEAVNVSAISPLQTVGGIDSLATVQAALSQLPKEYQEIIKSKLQNIQGSSGAGQAPGVIPVDWSSLPPEYQSMLKSSLEKLQPATQDTKN